MEECVEMFVKHAKWDLNWQVSSSNSLASTVAQAQLIDKRQASLKELICALVTKGANGHNLSEQDKTFVKTTLNES